MLASAHVTVEAKVQCAGAVTDGVRSSKGQRFGECGYQAAFHCDDVTSAPQTRRPEITWGMLKITWGCHAMNHTIFNQQHVCWLDEVWLNVI